MVTLPAKLQELMMKSMKIMFTFVEALFLIIYSSNVSANGWNAYVDSMSEGRGSSGMFEGIVLMVALGGIILFAWTAYGKKSIRYVYGPMALGLVIILLIGDRPERILSIKGMLFGPIVGLIVGWLIIGGLTLLGVIDYFEHNDEQKPEPPKPSKEKD